MQHRANLIPPPTTPSPEVAEDVPARPTSPLTNDTVAHALPPARQQSEEFFVPDPIDHLLHLADDGSAQGGAKAAPSHGDTVEHPADHPADHPTEHTDQALTHDADDSNGSTDMARLGGRSDEVSKKRGRRSNDASAALDLVCSKAIEMFESTALEYGLAPEQVFAHFQKTEQRFRNVDNPWNIYQRYFNCFVEEETSRLQEDLQSTVRASGGRVSSTAFILLPRLVS